MKIIRPDGSIGPNKYGMYSDIYTVDGWYLMIHDDGPFNSHVGYQARQHPVDEIYLKNSNRIGFRLHGSGRYLFEPNFRILNSKEEFHRYLKLMVFI